MVWISEGSRFAVAETRSEAAIPDIETCAKRLSAGILQSVIYDQQWRTFGFKHRPRRGRMWDRFVEKERLKVEYFLGREFAIIALALTCRSVKECFEYDWGVPIIARMFSILVGEPAVLHSFHFDTIEEGVSYFERGAKCYLRSELDEWQGILLKRTPKLEQKKYQAGMFLGTALIMEPTHSIFPHVATASRNICSATPLVGQVMLPSANQDRLVDAARQLFGCPPGAT